MWMQQGRNQHFWAKIEVSVDLETTDNDAQLQT